MSREAGTVREGSQGEPETTATKDSVYVGSPFTVL